MKKIFLIIMMIGFVSTAYSQVVSLTTARDSSGLQTVVRTDADGYLKLSPASSGGAVEDSLSSLIDSLAILIGAVDSSNVQIQENTDQLLAQLKLLNGSATTRIDTVINIATSAALLSSFIGAVDFSGGMISIMPATLGTTVAVGSSSNVGSSATNSGDILQYLDSYRDNGKFHNNTNQIWVKGSAATTYIRLKIKHN